VPADAVLTCQPDRRPGACSAARASAWPAATRAPDVPCHERVPHAARAAHLL